MKKFILFALCAISTLSVFAEPFSNEKLNQIVKTKQYDAMKKYCYESQVSAESNYNHMFFTLEYNKSNKKDYLTIDEINAIAKKFEGKIDNNSFQMALGNSLAINGYTDQAIKINEKINSTTMNSLIFNRYIYNKNKQKVWQFGKKIIICDGEGFYNSKEATNILTKMFRYKPVNISKEQQIEFLSKLAQIYPIPGSDFNKWKSFMGFVGYKYKALTGKDLF